MKNDPIIEEIHQIRGQILNACDGNLDKLMDQLKASENRDRSRLVSLETVRKHREGGQVSGQA